MAASEYPIPKDALDDRLAFVGTSGSGKTYAAGTAVERLLAADAKVVIVDPLDVWWGLRVKTDGKREGFPVAIFGGSHADLPLTEASGAVIGEAVACTSQSCIISLAELGSKAAERRFMLAFLEVLYRKAAGEPFHLIFDEADLWAPQRPDEPKLHYLMGNIVRRGRIKGFIPWLITQRPAVLSKDILSQADGLVAMKLTSSQDRAALGAWIEGQADRSEEKALLAKVARFQRGEAVVWIPARGVLADVAFPAKSTFDSSVAPKRGEVRRTAELKLLDVAKLSKAIATAQDERAKPKASPRDELAVSQAAFEDALKRQPLPPDTRAVREAEDRARALGREEGRRIGHAEGYRQAQKEAQAALSALHPGEPTLASLPQRQTPAATPPARIQSPQAAPPGPQASMSKAERLILTALAQYPAGRTKTQVAILTGYSSSGGGFGNALSSLRTKGWIEGTTDLVITEAGRVALGPFERLPQGRALLDHWLGQLSKAERACLTALADVYPRTLSKEELAERAGYEASGGGFGNALSRLRTLELITGFGEMKASDALFSEAA